MGRTLLGRVEGLDVSKTTTAMVGWTVAWAVVLWAVDPANTVGGKPPAWILFEAWAGGLVTLGAIRVGVLEVGRTGTAWFHWRRILGIPGAAILWTLSWMALFPVWALDPRATVIGQGHGGPPPPLKTSEPTLYMAWLVGLAVIAAIWLVSRARKAGLGPR